jgi:hypothetical protein
MTDTVTQLDSSFQKRLDDFSAKASLADRARMKALAGILLAIDSNLDRSVKFDLVRSTIDMLVSSVQAACLIKAMDCHRDTKVPLDSVVAIMACRFCDTACRDEDRFSNLMPAARAQQGSSRWLRPAPKPSLSTGPDAFGGTRSTRSAKLRRRLKAFRFRAARIVTARCSKSTSQSGGLVSTPMKPTAVPVTAPLSNGGAASVSRRFSMPRPPTKLSQEGQ